MLRREAAQKKSSGDAAGARALLEEAKGLQSELKSTYAKMKAEEKAELARIRAEERASEREFHEMLKSRGEDQTE